MILDYIKKNNLFDYIRNSCRSEDVIYIGASAGAMIAGQDIRLALEFDKTLLI